MIRRKSTVKGAGAAGVEPGCGAGNEAVAAGKAVADVATAANGEAAKEAARNGAAEGRPFDGGFEAWLVRAEALGLGPGERVWELHVVQGRSVGEAARLLGLTGTEVEALCAEMRALRAARAPRAEADFLAVREELRDRLVSILEDASRVRDDPRLLAVRQRVCDQLSDLYGLKMQRRGTAEEVAVPYVLPADKEVAVKRLAERVLGREEDIQGAKAGLALTGGGV